MKIDKLIEKTTEKSEKKKWKVVVGIVVGLILALSIISVYLFVYVDVDTYLSETKGMVALYDFYDLKVGEDESAVFFVGSSVMGLSVYPPYIDEELSRRGYNIKTYNLLVESDIPLERSLEIQKIIDSKPSLVIYGVTYRSVISGISQNRLEQRTKLVYPRLNIRPDSLYLFTDEELREYVFQPPTWIYLKTFVKSAMTYNGKSASSHTWDYTVDPYGIGFRTAYSAQKNPDKIIQEAENPYDEWHPTVTDEHTRYKEALLYNVQTLEDAGIPVIILNMPLHPLTSEKITNESRQNFYNLLNQTGAVWYDMEYDYGDEFFRDSHHAMFETGTPVFSSRMVDLIIQEMS